MKPIGFVYLTTNIINGKIYVGQHILSGNKKWNATYLGKGKKMSEEQKKRQSENMKGKYIGVLNPNYGNKWNEKQRKHLSEIKKKQYKGRKWINNGEQEKFVNIDNGIPQGYLLGRLRKSIQ